MIARKLVNPLRVWAELARGLHGRYVAELGEERSPHARQILDGLAVIATRCEGLGVLLERLQERDPKGFDAFVRALENS